MTTTLDTKSSSAAPTLFAYPAALHKGPDGRVTATFRDLPEALTDGIDETEALHNAADALSEALEGRIADGEAVPLPSRPRRGERIVAPDPVIAAKVALHRAAREQNITAAELARRLDIDHKEARRILDPGHKSKIPRMAQALDAMGQSVALVVFEKSGRDVVHRKSQTERFLKDSKHAAPVRRAGGKSEKSRSKGTLRKKRV